MASAIIVFPMICSFAHPEDRRLLEDVHFHSLGEGRWRFLVRGSHRLSDSSYVLYDEGQDPPHAEILDFPNYDLSGSDFAAQDEFL